MKEAIKTLHIMATSLIIAMNWRFDINRIKLSNMSRYKGLCISDGKNLYINLSLKENEGEKDMQATLIHELIHAQLFASGYKHAHKHGKVFRKIARRIAKMSDGYFSEKDIV